MIKKVHVAVGLVQNADRHILIAKRPDKAHQGGLWEFPGGKVEAGESALGALIREFKEEVALTIHSATHILTVEHDYGDKHVCLDVWLARDFIGTAQGAEGQQVRWISIAELSNYRFPEANQPILDKLKSG